ncbi:MAG: hypothetical protein WBP22_00835 [Candidatus Saccharimonas sp.]
MKTLVAMQRAALAPKLHQMVEYYWSVFRSVDEPVELIQTRGPIGSSRIAMWLYQHSSEIIGRDVHRTAWTTKVAHNSWIDDHYGFRELAITTEGELVESYTVPAGTGPIVRLRIVGPNMLLSEDDLSALTALADNVITRYQKG